jgi:hypothetical protein
MARRPKNPINDIINTTSAWLGGNRGTMPSQTRKGIDAIKGVGKVLDSATGGFGQAVVSDAQSGSNTPSALYKTAAVNLAAAATGVGAAKVVGKLTKNLSTRTGVHLSNTPNLNIVSYSEKRAGSGLTKNFPAVVESGKTYKFSPFIGRSVNRLGRVAKEDIYTRQELSNIVAKTNVGMAEKTGNQTAAYGYITRSRVGQPDEAFGRGWTEARTTGRQRVVSQVNLPRVAASATEAQKQANIRAVSNALADAFERRRQAQQTAAGIVAGLSAQQGGRKARGGGKNKR